MNMMFQPNHTAMQRAKGLGRLSVKLRGDESCIDRRHEAGAAKLRFPKRSDGQFEAVLINTAGGLTGGDEMRWQFDVAAQCAATFTTQACEKIYASSGDVAKVTTHITAGSESKLAWLPQESILFDKSQLTRSLTVDLAAGAEALIVEPVALGRLAMGEHDITGQFQDRWRISQSGRLIHAEDFKIGPDISAIASAASVLGGAGSFATVLLISPRGEALLDSARDIIGHQGGASFWNGKLLARLVAEDAYQLRKRLIPLISLLNFEAALPQCWSL